MNGSVPPGLEQMVDVQMASGSMGKLPVSQSSEEPVEVVVTVIFQERKF